MPKFQVVNVTPKAGVGKGGKPYELLVIDGVFTGDDGRRFTCEHVIFKRGDHPLPSIESGAVYEPVSTTYVNQDKKLTAGVFELRRVKVAA